ncbi:integrase, catalytic region, zinc finger, CCHC-type containing protein [Tanacetum coccineum]
MQQPMPNPKDITDPTAAMNMALALMAKAFKLNRISSNPQNRQITQSGMNLGQDNQMHMVGGNGGNQFRQYDGQNVGNQELHSHTKEKGCSLSSDSVADCSKGRSKNPTQASTLGTQSEKAPVYDSDGSAEVQLHDNCYNNEIFNMFTQEEQYTELLEPIPEPHEVPHNDSNVISEVSSMEQGGGIVEQHHTNVEETRVLYDSLYNNLATKVEKVNSVNRKLRKTNANLTTELARYKNQERCFEISQEKYDKLERCYQQSVYQEQSSESLAKHKALELEIERLLREVVSQNIMSIVQNNSIVDTSNLQTELEQCKYDKISYDKAYNDMQQKIERLQAQLGDQKGKSKDTPCESNTLDPLPQKLENENVELEFQNKLHDTIYKNAKLRAQLFDKVSEQKDTSKGTSTNTKFANQSTERKPFLQSLRNQFVVRQPNAFQSERPKFSKNRIPQKVDTMNDLSNPVTSNSVPITNESKVVDNDKVIAPGMFRINPFKNSREEKSVPNKPTKASVRKNPITVSQPHVIIKKVVNSDSNGFSSTGVDITTKTRGPQPRSNTKNDRVPSASKSSRIKNKEVEDHPRNLLLSKNNKHMSSECNNIKLAIRNDNSEIVCAICKQCLITSNHDACVLHYVNGMKSRSKKHKANVSKISNQMKHKAQMFDIRGKIIASSESNGDNACCSKHMTGNLKLLINFVWKFLGTIRFGNDHVSAILDLEVAFRRNTYFLRNLKGVDLLKGNRTTNLYTINLHDMASASPICLMASATSTKSWLWHQRLSHLNFDTINDLARNDLVTGLPKFKYHKEHLCPFYEQGKSKRASHPPKPVPNSKQRLHLLHMDLCGPMRIASINGKRVVERRNCTLVEAAKTMLIFSRAPLFLWAEAIATACCTQNHSVIHRRFDKTPYELINGRKPDISFLHVFGALCYPKNDREDIGKLGAKGDIGFFIGYYANSCAYRVYNRRTKKIMETMNVTFDELSTMAFEQSSLKPGL